MQTKIVRVKDFEVDGAGTAAAWRKTKWQSMVRVGGRGTYASRVKMLYSASGIYFLFDNEDRTLNCTLTEDFSNIFTEDVVEIFLWPDPGQKGLYFEYEISPLDVELPILIPNHRGTFMGWKPWQYDGPRRTRHATQVRGGPKKSGAAIEGWSAEVFIPFMLLKGLGRTPPKSGTRWRANLYRIDYDLERPTHWAWCHDTGVNFHRYQEFGTIVFE